MSYIIPGLEDAVNMDRYRTLNTPRTCAEDIVHAKLRVLKPKGAGEDAITTPNGEIGLEDKDNLVLNQPNDASKEVLNAATAGAETRAIVKYMTLGTHLGAEIKGLEKKITDAKKILGVEVQEVPVPEDEEKLLPKDRGLLNKRRADVEKLKTAQKEARNVITASEPSLQQKNDELTDMKLKRDKHIRSVHTYLLTISLPDLTGETNP
jgi:hypothetical protein